MKKSAGTSHVEVDPGAGAKFRSDSYIFSIRNCIFWQGVSIFRWMTLVTGAEKADRAGFRRGETRVLN